MNDDNSDLVNPYAKLPEMKNGGFPLYNMAGGGPLFMTADLSAQPIDIKVPKQASGGGDSGDGGDGGGKLTMNWVSGDLMEAEQKLANFQKVYQDAVLKYGGNTRLALQDPYVKQANMSMTPNPVETALKTRRRENFDLARAYINQENNHRGAQLDIDEMEKFYMQKGYMPYLTAGETHRAYENTPMSQLNNSTIGSTWDKQGKIVATETDYNDAFKASYAPAIESMLKSNLPLKEQMIQIVSPLGDKVVEMVKAGMKKSSSNEQALDVVFDQLSRHTSPVIENGLKQKYLSEHVDENGNMIPYLDKEGKYTEDYKVWKKNELKDEFNKRLRKEVEINPEYVSTRYADWDAALGKVVEDKTNPFRILFDPLDREAQNLPYTTPSGIAGDKTNVYNVSTRIPTYAVTPTHREVMSGLIGEKYSNIGFKNILRGSNGGLFQLPPDLDLGVVVGFGPVFTKFNKADIRDDGTLDQTPEAVYDKKEKKWVANTAAKKTPWIGMTLMVSKDDIKKMGSSGTFAPDPNDKTKMVYIPYDVDKSNGQASDIFGQLDIRHTGLGSADLTNEELADMKLKTGETLGDKYKLSTAMINKDTYLIKVYSQMPETYLHENIRTESRFMPEYQTSNSVAQHAYNVAGVTVK